MRLPFCINLLILSSYLFVHPLDCTLSKSSKSAAAVSKKDVRAAKSTKTVSTKTTRADDTAGAGLTAEQILLNQKRIDNSEKMFQNEVLGYVTPWNSHGYDLVKWQAHKFTLVSPVWFQIVPLRDSNPATCTIEGEHDLDRDWLKSVHEKNSEARIVPRFLFEKWMPGDYMRLFTDALEQERCLHVLLHFLQRNQFHGAALELWMSVMSMSQGQAAKDLVHFVINWAELMKSNNLLSILPVSPPLTATMQESGMFTSVHYQALVPFVDYFSVMTYDFPERKLGRIGPLAPLDWVHGCMMYLLNTAPEQSNQLLMGLNFYGHEQTTTTASIQPITAKRYIELLEAHKPKMHWNKQAAEHYMQVGKQHVVYFPSLASIEARLKLAKTLGVGIAIWDCGQGLDYFYNLI